VEDGYHVIAEDNNLRITVFQEHDHDHVDRCVFVTETSKECEHCGQGAVQLGLASWDILDFEERVIQVLESEEDQTWVREKFHAFLIAEAQRAGRMLHRA
jgi:hypothetical protein